MKLEFKRKSVKVINFCLKSVGINVYQRNIPLRKFYQFSSILPTISAIIHMSLYIIVNRDKINEVIILAAFMGASVILVASVRTFAQNKNKILKLMQIMDKNVYSYPNEEVDFFDKKNCSNAIFFVLGYEFFGFSLSLLSPFMAFILTGVYETSIYPGWYPLYENSILIMITNILQISGCITTFWLYYVIQIFVTFVTIELLRQYQRLRIILRDIPRKTESTVLRKMKRHSWYCSLDNRGHYGYNFQQRYNDEFQLNVLHCVKHHQELWKLFRLFEPWFSTFYSMELVMSAVTFALVFNNLLSARNPSTFLTIIGSTFNVMANMFSRCIVGEIYAEMNTNIKNIIFYDMDWWELSIENKKLLIMFHKISSKSYEFKGCSIFTASYYTFAQLMRISYSYFNIIRSSLEINSNK